MRLQTEQLLQQPDLREIYLELGHALDIEAEARASFRASLRDDERAEFINGEVLVQMAARVQHNRAVKNLVKLLDTFVVSRKLGAVGSGQCLTEFSRNDYCPDVCYWRAAKSRAFIPEQLIYPIPDFISEVLSETTEHVDRGVKRQDYAAQAVGEYWIVDPLHQLIEQYVLRNGRYELNGRPSTGMIRSKVVRGFRIPVRAVFDDDENLAYLKEMLA